MSYSTAEAPIDSLQQQITTLGQSLSQRIIGQEKFITRLLIALLCDGHLLVEGAPGLAKTKAIKELAYCIEGNFHRIQFTPDLLPGDLTGTDIYRPDDGSFSFQPGPIFHNIVLADEINRAPAKVQSALLEAMAERQVTIGRNTYRLPALFMVMATQNPLEQEGTYPLPEAQLDRFLMYIHVDYPSTQTEHKILQLAREEAVGSERSQKTIKKITEQTILQARQEVLTIHMSRSLEDYLVELIIASRNPNKYNNQLGRWLQYGASPRATIALDRCAKAHAWLHQRDYVTPEDIQAVAPDVLRHRIILSFEAEAEGINTDDFINELLNQIAIP